MPEPACGCLHLSVFASVNVHGLTASQLKMQGKGKKKKKVGGVEWGAIDISESNQGNMLTYVTGREPLLVRIFNSV